MLFMVEAKTSYARYSLPADDERAVIEYVAEARRNLVMMHPLRFLLIVGPEPTRTLANKLALLESRIQLLTRYVDVESLARMRASWNGPLDFELLFQLMAESPVVLTDDVFSRLSRITAFRFEPVTDYIRRAMTPLGQLAVPESAPQLEIRQGRVVAKSVAPKGNR
jgi:hypothetical protein